MKDSHYDKTNLYFMILYTVKLVLEGVGIFYIYKELNEQFNSIYIIDGFFRNPVYFTYKILIALAIIGLILITVYIIYDYILAMYVSIFIEGKNIYKDSINPEESKNENND